MSNSFETLWIVACQAPLSMGFPRQEYWSGLPFSPPGDLCNLGIKPTSPALAGGFFTTEPPGKPNLFPRMIVINLSSVVKGASLVAQLVKNPPAMRETRDPSLGWEDPLEKEMATHSIILAWRVPWTGEPGGLQSMGLQRVIHNWASNTHIHTHPWFPSFFQRAWHNWVSHTHTHTHTHTPPCFPPFFHIPSMFQADSDP